MTIMYCPDCKTYADCKSSKNENVFRKDGKDWNPKRRVKDPTDPFETVPLSRSFVEFEGELFWHERTRTCGVCDYERRTAELDSDKLRLLMEENERLRDVLDTIFSLIGGGRNMVDANSSRPGDRDP